ncbi:non-hydrolyzing UDP-N-acetylglucosamine 2-epimerase [Haloferax sp. YSMS24]|uniref:non-hydrolyzing UDP-N-acetylglucosamine 2-epimerase n=1 Tax=Haloferax sp. YSMS24 TaxID=3388425 RepID=UPI00398D5C53
MQKTNEHIAIVLGTRPEIIKQSPIIRECLDRDISYSLIHTGQHYSDDLDSVFFSQLELPEPNYHLGVGSGTHGKQTGEMIARIEEVLQNEEPTHVLVQGDTNTVLAGAIAASKLPTKIGHIEAGLRSFNREMPEETNRVLTDHVSDYLFTPTESSKQHLLNEGIQAERIYVTGNTIVDAVEQNIDLAREKSGILNTLSIEQDDFMLLTAHRAENVDSATRFESLLEGVAKLSKRQGVPVVYPVHPRSREKIETFGIDIPEQITAIEPLNFLDFLILEDTAQLVLTDSGGVQEETSILHTPCVTLRDETERPETIDVGANEIAGINPESILQAGIKMLEQRRGWENPYGDGTASKQIIDILCSDNE